MTPQNSVALRCAKYSKPEYEQDCAENLSPIIGGGGMWIDPTYPKSLQHSPTLW